MILSTCQNLKVIPSLLTLTVYEIDVTVQGHGKINGPWYTTQDRIPDTHIHYIVGVGFELFRSSVERSTEETTPLLSVQEDDSTHDILVMSVVTTRD